MRLSGIIFIAVFLMIPLLFIVFYFNSDQMYSTRKQSSALLAITEEQSGEIPLNQSQISEHTEETDRSHTEDVFSEPEIEIIGVAYLTFDDGPSHKITPGILDILAEEGINATFFTLPYSDADDIFRRILSDGHEIGNHSYSHVYPTLYEGSISDFREDVIKARRFIEDNFGYSSTSFRFPGGSQDQSRSVRNPRIDVINELGYKYFDWDIDPNDWRQGRSAEEIKNDILNETHGREHVIILLHDVYERTLEALPMIIDGLREQGYEFDILSNHPG